MNELIAEFIGAHIGDGTLYRTNTGVVWELRGNLNERDYYINHMCPLVEKISGVNVKSKFRSGGKNGVWGIQTSKKDIINLLLKHGFKPGTKTYSVSVPQYIFDSDIKSKRAFVRGLFDTDGCLSFFRANKSKNKNYPRILFNFASKDLIDTLIKLLIELNFKPYSWKYKGIYSLAISGKNMAIKWFKEIKPKNPKSLKKYNKWLKIGYV